MPSQYRGPSPVFFVTRFELDSNQTLSLQQYFSKDEIILIQYSRISLFGSET